MNIPCKHLLLATALALFALGNRASARQFDPPRSFPAAYSNSQAQPPATYPVGSAQNFLSQTSSQQRVVREQPQAVDANTLFTSMTGFGVPVTVNNSDGRFIEVQLYVSKDRGKSWQFNARKSPDATEFPFHSGGDGEYWFALKTLDRDRKLIPDGNAQAQLKVIVDTRRPSLEFAAKTDAAGRVVCKWRAQDLHIDSQTLKIRYRPANDPNANWKAIEYRPQNPQSSSVVFADQLAWWPASQSRELVVQLEISDRAGNQSVDQRTVVVPRIANHTTNNATAFRDPNSQCPGGVCKVPSPDVLPGPEFRLARGAGAHAPMQRVGSLPEYADPPAPGPRTDHVTSPPKPVSLAPQPTRQQQNSSVAAHRGPESIEWGSQSAPAKGLQQQFVGSTTNSTGQGGAPNQVARPSNPNQIVGSGAARSGFIKNDFIDQHQANRQTSATEMATIAPKRDSNSTPQTPSRDQNNQLVSGPNSVPTPRAIPDVASRLAHLDIKAINSRKFLLNYNVDSVDPSGVGKVVLWTTRDGGETWKSWANDNDTSSPFPVEVDENGIYGFRIVIHSNDGLSGKPPLRGDEADMWVRIDTEAPVAQIISAPYGTGNEVGRLIINWQASDEKLRTKPIKLSYSTAAQGPWTTIENGVRNTGRYAWKIGRDIPDRIYLRMEVTDAAGNVTVQQLTRPIDVSGLVPRGRINGVQPIVTQ